jgi:hypothetical protein
MTRRSSSTVAPAVVLDGELGALDGCQGQRGLDLEALEVLGDLEPDAALPQPQAPAADLDRGARGELDGGAVGVAQLALEGVVHLDGVLQAELDLAGSVLAVDTGQARLGHQGAASQGLGAAGVAAGAGHHEEGHGRQAAGQGHRGGGRALEGLEEGGQLLGEARLSVGSHELVHEARRDRLVRGLLEASSQGGESLVLPPEGRILLHPVQHRLLLLGRHRAVQVVQKLLRFVVRVHLALLGPPPAGAAPYAFKD